MNSPSPLIPQGSNLEQQNKARSSLKVKIFCALGVNVAVLLVLLMQGCKREQPQMETITSDLPPVYDESNQPPVLTDYGQPGIADPGTSNIPPSTATIPGLPPVTETYVPPTPPPPAPEVAATEYTIQRGDTYSSIAPKFNISVSALQAANPSVDPTRLQIGKKLVIPAPTASTGASTAPTVNAALGETIYTVKSGDTLSRIASQYRTTVSAIKAANGLQTDRIKVGDKLKIPAK